MDLKLPKREDIINELISQLDDENLLPRQKLAILPALLKHDYNRGLAIALKLRQEPDLRNGIDMILLKYTDKEKNFNMQMIDVDTGEEYSYGE